MAIRHFNPVTPGQRKKSTLVNEELTKTAPEKSLLKAKNKKSGRNNQGRITVRHQGGGAKQKYRLIDFKRNKHDIEGLAFEALHSAKKIREVVNMWMNSLSTDKSDSREEILISLLLDLANTQVSLTSDIELAAKKLPLE